MLELFTARAKGPPVAVVGPVEPSLEGIEAWCANAMKVAEGMSLGPTDRVILELIKSLGIVAAEVSALKWRLEG